MSDHVLPGSLASRLPRSRSHTSIVLGDHEFQIPTKLIKTPSDMRIWEKSEAYYEYLGFILAINEAVKGKSNSQGREGASENVIKTVGVLDKLDAIIDETPPIDQPQRFGNVAFRTWFQKMRDESLVLLQEVFTSDHNKAIPEVVTYLVEAFGNATRIDYGTGHEISFIMFLCCLFKIGVLKDSDRTATGCYIFPRYLDLARKLQKTYRMEPAGSHGVWSLDDYQFVPFIWGSSQLHGHPVVEPHLFLQAQVLKEFGEDFMFLTCIQFINSVKTGPFAEHSNQLWSISGVSSWFKINGGLIKMYKAEVLSKFPVVQHIVFGSLFTLRPVEQCTGMMTPKYTMGPPPAISAASSVYSSRQSSKLSLHINDEKSLTSTQGSVPSSEKVIQGSTKGSLGESHRDSIKGSSKGSSKATVEGSDSSLNTIDTFSSEERSTKQGFNEFAMRQTEGMVRRADRGEVSEVPSHEEPSERDGVSSDHHTVDKESESVRFSTSETDEEYHGRKRNRNQNH